MPYDYGDILAKNPNAHLLQPNLRMEKLSDICTVLKRKGNTYEIKALINASAETKAGDSNCAILFTSNTQW